MACRLEELHRRWPRSVVEAMAPHYCPSCGVMHEKDGYTRIYQKEDEHGNSKTSELSPNDRSNLGRH